MELMVEVESLGFDSTWPREHHFSAYGFCGSPHLTLVAVAVKTTKINLWSGVVVLLFHYPIRVAENFSFFDHLSGSRIRLGLDIGYQPIEYKGFGVHKYRYRNVF